MKEETVQYAMDMIRTVKSPRTKLSAMRVLACVDAIDARRDRTEVDQKAAELRAQAQAFGAALATNPALLSALAGMIPEPLPAPQPALPAPDVLPDQG
jgi:hypothetical protein